MVVVAVPLIQGKSDIDVTDVCQDESICPSAQTDTRRYRYVINELSENFQYSIDFCLKIAQKLMVIAIVVGVTFLT